MEDLMLYATGAATPVRQERTIAARAKTLHSDARLGGFEMNAVYALGGLAMNGSEALGRHRMSLESSSDEFTVSELRRIQHATNVRAVRILDRFGL
jgi:hypothetical protein